MSRLDWKHGRFDIDVETEEAYDAMRGWTSTAGDEILYYRFDKETSTSHPVYDEASAGGKIYIGPTEVYVLHVTDEEGPTDDTGAGFYYNNRLHVRASFEAISRTGLTEMDLRHENYLRDRIVYNNRVFRVTQIAVLGQVQQRDMIVSIEATQVKPDELVNDPQFAEWSA